MRAAIRPWVFAAGFASCAILSLSPAVVAPARADESEWITRSKVYAGTSGGTCFTTPSVRDAYQAYALQADRAWAKYDQLIATPMAQWASSVLPRDEGETVFYPFAGPDFPTLHRLYPDASRYIMVSRQWARRGQDPCALTLPRAIADFRRMEEAARNFAKRGYFITKELNQTFSAGGAYEGLVWLLAFFADREGYSVLQVEPIRVMPAGDEVEIHPGDRDREETWASVRLTLRDRRNDKIVLLDYLSINLLDSELQKAPQNIAFLKRAAGNRVLIKAASHLLQISKGFTIIRDQLLQESKSILQDETAIPYRMLAERFQTRLFGDYRGSSAEFSSSRELLQAFRERKDVEPLPMRFGYRKKAGWCIILAVPLKARASAAPPAAASADLP